MVSDKIITDESRVVILTNLNNLEGYMQLLDTEMVYGIYYGDKIDNYYGPKERREAGCVISENQSDEDLIKHLIASDFLCQWTKYIVIDNGPSIHIFHNINGKQGGIALVLMYEEDL